MDKITEYIEIGERLGLAGSELREFVKKREKEEKELAKEQREMDRAREKEEKELALARERDRKEEMKEKDRVLREERANEREMKKLEMEKMEKENQMRITLYEKEIELERAKKSVTGSVGKTKVDCKAKMPKLPHFNDKSDSMDAYLKRFERFAYNAGWDEEDWATNLSALLQGKALEVYSRLSSDDALSYDTLKEALLKRFQLTEEGFRSKFRSSKPEVGETAQQFVVRLEDYLMHWMELAKAPANFEGLVDLLLREQFMNVSPKHLQVFLKEHKVKTVQDMTDLAQQFQEAHNLTDFTQSNSPKPRNGMNRQDNQNQSTMQSGSTSGGKTCYNCKATTHFIRDCPDLKDHPSKVQTNGFSQTPYSQRGGR